MSPAASYKEGKTYFSGGAGLTSTARDYARFANMLVAGGALGSVRLLSPKTVELMASSHTSDIQEPRSSARARPSGLASKSLRTSPRRNVGIGRNVWVEWDLRHHLWVHPKEQLVSIMMVQRYPGPTVAASFLPLVYQAVTRSLVVK